MTKIFINIEKYDWWPEFFLPGGEISGYKTGGLMGEAKGWVLTPAV